MEQGQEQLIAQLRRNDIYFREQTEVEQERMKQIGKEHFEYLSSGEQWISMSSDLLDTVFRTHVVYRLKESYTPTLTGGSITIKDTEKQARPPLMVRVENIENWIAEEENRRKTFEDNLAKDIAMIVHAIGLRS